MAILKNFLEVLVAKEGSHLYLSPGSLPSVKIGDELFKLGKNLLTVEDTIRISQQIMNDEQIAAFAGKTEMDVVVDAPRLGRFSVNVFRQRNKIAMVFRVVKTAIPRCDDLNIPQPLKAMAVAEQGLLFFGGRNSEEKSAAIAALINHRNENEAGHIITLEEPISFVHSHKLSILNQREIGVDTGSYREGLASAVRQAPDMLFIGEVRNRETLEYALSMSQSGCLCLISINTESSEQAVDRLLNLFPGNQLDQLYLDLSLQTLALTYLSVKEHKKKASSKYDLLMSSPLVKDLIKKGDSHKISMVVEAAERTGAKSFDVILKNALELRKSTAGANMASVPSPDQTSAKGPASTGGPVKNDLGWEVEPIIEAQRDKEDNAQSA